MPAKKRTASQSRWLHEHFSDPYVKQAHKLGLRSRASFKLEELQKKAVTKKWQRLLIHPEMVILLRG